MRRFIVLSVILLTGTVAGFAAAPVANVISTESFDINGITAPARNFIPLELGGEVSTRSSTAVIQFSDGTTVVLQPNSQLKIEGRAASPEIHLLRGSAQYKLSPGSHTHVVNGSESVADKLLDDTAAYRAGLPPAAVLYRAPSAAAIAPTSPISTTAFLTGAISQGTLITHAASGGATGPTITTPSGLTINLTPTTNPATGVTTYTVASITQVITEPNGTQTSVQITSGPLIGATVGVTPTAQTSGAGTTSTTVAISLTPVGSTTPLTPTQASTAVTTSVSTAVQTAVASGALPAGTTTPSPSPASTGNFSPSAP